MLNTAGSICRSIFYYRAITCVCSAFPLNSCLSVRSRRVCGFIWSKKKSHVFHLYVICLLQTEEFIFSFWVQCPVCLICFCCYLITLSQSQKTIRRLIAFHSAQRTASVPVKVQLNETNGVILHQIYQLLMAICLITLLENSESSFSLGALGAMMPWKCEFKMKSISEK